jgi:hypothetical protein
MKRLLLVSLVAVAVGPSARADAGDVDPPSQPLSTSPQHVQSPVRRREMSLKEGDKMAHGHEKRDSNNKKKRMKNRMHKTEKKVNAGQGVTLEDENILLMASADADAQRGKAKKKKGKAKPTQITYFTTGTAFGFFLNITGGTPIPIPPNYTLPAGSYNFTYDNRSPIMHNFVVHAVEPKNEILAATAICRNCTSSTGIVKFKAHERVFFHCEPHEPGMGFNATIVKST